MLNYCVRQRAAIPHLLPAPQRTRARVRRGHADVEGSGARPLGLPRLLRLRVPRLHHLRLCRALPRPDLGELPRTPRHAPCGHPIFSPDPDDVEVARTGQLVGADDVHSDAGQLRVRGEFGG